MAAIDFVTAFGRLLHDGALRDTLAANPQTVAVQLNLAKPEWLALRQIDLADLEFQARVLLRKRLDIVRRIIPETCRRLATNEWTLFHEYARHHWPEASAPVAKDAHDFCLHLQRADTGTVDRSEWNRLRFAISINRFSMHLARRTTVGGQPKWSLQVLFRLRRRNWHEVFLSFSL